MKKLVIITSVFALGTLGASAQSTISMYNFDRVGNFMQANPAGYQPYRVVVGVPGISNISVYTHNAAFDIEDALSPDLTTNESLEYILTNTESGDRLLTSYAQDILYVGFRTGNSFWSIGASMNSTINFEYPIELLELAYYGGASEEVNGMVQLSQNATQVNSYLSYHLGYQHELMDGRLRVGGRFKYLSGIAHASIPQLDLDAQLDATEWTFQSDIRAQISSPIPLNTEQGQGVNLDPMDFALSDNRGYAFDLGASFEILPRLEISAAATDIGSITWRSNTTTYTSQGTFTWDGAEYGYPSKPGEEFNTDSIIGEIVDALEFEETQGEEFTTSLPMNLMAGVRYDITRKHAFSATYQMNRWEGGRVYNNIGVSYIGNWSKWFSFYANYAIIDNDRMNVGVGFSANLGPIQLYFLTEDALIATGENLNLASLRFGMNVALYRKDLRGYEPDPEDVVPTPAPADQATEQGSEETDNE